jgi:putative hydrolase of the HAD superfamily
VSITHVFFDVGGVLGSGGWGTLQRAAGVAHFGLDGQELNRRHFAVTAAWEEGRMSLDEYLDHAVFHVPRPFSREAFTEFMLEQSTPCPETIALARGLAAAGRWRLMTLNNESETLNRHRIRVFGLAPIFHAFLSSCWLGVTKPSRRIYERALAIAQVRPDHSVFIDDRPENLEPAHALGMRTIRFTTVADLAGRLAALGVSP